MTLIEAARKALDMLKGGFSDDRPYYDCLECGRNARHGHRATCSHGNAIAAIREAVERAELREKFQTDVRFLATKAQADALRDLVGKLNSSEYCRMPPRSIMLVNVTTEGLFRPDGAKFWHADVKFRTSEDWHKAYDAGDFSIFAEMPTVEREEKLARHPCPFCGTMIPDGHNLDCPGKPVAGKSIAVPAVTIPAR